MLPLSMGQKTHETPELALAFLQRQIGHRRVVQTHSVLWWHYNLHAHLFALQFNVFDGTLGRSLVGTWLSSGLDRFQSDSFNILYWVYQILAVALLASAP